MISLPESVDTDVCGRRAGRVRRRGSACAAVIGSVVACGLLLTACRSIESPPPGLSSGSGGSSTMQSSAPAAVRYALSSWYLARFQHRADLASGLYLARQERQAAARDLFEAWRTRMLAAHGPVLTGEGERELRLSADALGERADSGAPVSVLERIAADLSAGISVRVDAAACLDESLWQGWGRSSRSSFREWLDDRVLTVPFPDDFNAGLLRRELDRARLALAARQSVLRALSEADRLVSERRFCAALDRLAALSRELPEAVSLSAVGDTTTLAQFREQLAFLPSACVASSCDQLERVPLRKAREQAAKLDTAEADPRLCENYLQAFEASLAGRLREWDADPRFASAVAKHSARLRELAAEAGACRVALWRRELRDLAAAESYWAATLAIRSFYERLENPKSDVGFLYAFVDSLPAPQDPLPMSVRTRIRDGVREVYVRLLVSAFDTVLQAAQRNVNLSLRHGVSIALCGMLTRMLEPVPGAAQSADLAAPVARLEEQLRSSVSYFERELASRSVVVHDMSSAIPGLGVTFAKDIQGGLRSALAECGLDRYVQVRGPNGATGGRDLIVEDGHIASFEADETTTTRDIRTVRRWGPIEPIPQPDDGTAPDNGQNPPEENRPRFTQTQYEYAIHVKRIERVAHVRLGFQLRAAGQTTPLEINEFYRRAFVQEELHPFGDVRDVQTVKGDAPEELHPEEGPPDLTHERIWTSSEMLDWARKETQFLAISEILLKIEDAPVRLSQAAEAAEAAGDWLAAADSWGYCYQYCRHLKPRADSIRTLLNTPALDSHRRQILERQLAQQTSLVQLKEAAGEAMIDAVLKALDRTKPGVADVDRRPAR